MTGYVYDASGTRISKGSISVWSCDPSSNGYQATSDYILGPGGEQLTEMGINAAGGGSKSLVWAHTNVFAAGKLLATHDNDGLHFHLTDPLGTRRVNTDYAGVVDQTCSTFPFGDTGNCATQGPTQHLYTGKERDTKSGLDYFGARYYASSMGRFTSPDPSGLVYADPTNPQSLNLYNYVLNNPLVNVDPNGLDCIYINNDTGALEGFDRGDCNNSDPNKANTGNYVDGTVNTLYSSNAAFGGTYQGYDATGDDGNPLFGREAQQPDSQTPAPGDPGDDRPYLTAVIKEEARRNAGFPTVCSVGVYGQVGAGDFAVGGSYDSKKGGKGYGRQTFASAAPFSVTGKYDSNGHLSGGVNVRDPETGIGAGASVNDDGHVGLNASIQRAIGFGKFKANATGGVSATLGPIGDPKCRIP